MNRPYRSNGFTLLEVLIALLILVFGLVSIFSLFGIGAQSHYRGVNDVIIASGAATILAEIRSEFISGHPLQDVQDQTHPALPSNFKYDVAFQPLSDPVAGETLVTITIKWPSERGLESEKFQTVLTK